jgi:histidinol dehydrogenase
MSEATLGIEAATAAADAPPLRFRGAAAALSAIEQRQLFDRALSVDDAVGRRTAEIIARVREQRDRALVALARELDGVTLDALEVPRREVRAALDRLAPTLRRAIERSAANIASVHRAFLPRGSETSPEPGIVIGRRPDPLERVGVYAPGGRAAYPSSVLMGAIPARVAGVGEVILCTPPGADGLPNEIILAAAALAGVDRVFAVGGAGAIAAMAFGTESVPRVDRIVGPGNAYVAEAKLQLAGIVGIDAPAGPSELMVIADSTSDPALVARELLAQAEHDPLACVVALVVGEDVARAVEDEMTSQLVTTARREIIEAALRGQGAVLAVGTLDEAVALANRYAPEHLLLALPSAERCAELAQAVRNAGTIFVGESASNAFGDYMTGANHVLPTLGLARSYSGLSVLDFVRWTTYQRVSPAAASALAADVAIFAQAEGLTGHASAAAAWSGFPASDERSPHASRPSSIFIRAEIADLPLYTEAADVGAAVAPNERVDVLDLSDNTNLWGAPPAAMAALRESSTVIARYPSPYSGELKRALARYVGWKDAGIVTGCGSDDVLDAAMRALAAPGDAIAFSNPTFSMIPVFARANGLRPIAVPFRDENCDIDAERLAATGAELLYICAPNNPTATTVSRAALEYVIERAPGIVIVDEAYAEFANANNVDLVSRYPRLLVTRTLSKAFGLAGLRVGYGVGDPVLTGAVERARGPYNVTTPGERVALAALTEGPTGLGWVREHARLATQARDDLLAALRTLGVHPLPSAANFVLVPHFRAPEIGRRLCASGIIVRVLSNLPGTPASLAVGEGNALRIAVGPTAAMARFLDAFAKALR